MNNSPEQIKMKIQSDEAKVFFVPVSKRICVWSVQKLVRLFFLFNFVCLAFGCHLRFYCVVSITLNIAHSVYSENV